jgi:DUF1680 family protein
MFSPAVLAVLMLLMIEGEAAVHVPTNFDTSAAREGADISWSKMAGPVTPLPMSAVHLSGDWHEAQRRNREVLMSLNMSQWACHFTTTANLTRCEATNALSWHAYEKIEDHNFKHSYGFLDAGDDLPGWPASANFAQCQVACVQAHNCRGFSFQSLEPRPAMPVRCFLKSSIRLTLSRSNCVALGGAERPSCEPLPGEMGLGGYFGHYQGHWLSATAFLINSTGNSTVRSVANSAVVVLADVMAAWKSKYGYDGYLFPYDPLVFDKLLSGHGAGPYYSVPFYTLHKLMAGLLDQYVYARSTLALDLVVKMAGWVSRVVKRTLADGGETLWQRVLLTEWGGMNDVLFNLYSVTGDPAHLAAGRRFNAFVFTAPLAMGTDDIADQPFPHANFHLPEAVGNARAYALTSNETDRDIASTFFNALTANHSYATGGSSSGECWQQPRDLGNFLSAQTEESCTQYNVLKLARQAFMWEGQASFADFYELALWNGILGNQKRDDAEGPTSYIYMLPLGGAQFKPWGKSDHGFPCCWGTLSEAFAKLDDSIFFASADGSALLVTQFVDATLAWDAHGIEIEQRAAFPAHPTETATITVRVPDGKMAAYTLSVRVPSWASSGNNSIMLNGLTLQSKVQPGVYVHIKRSWADGDYVSLSFPLTLWTNPLNDRQPSYNATLAFMFGPLVLAGVHLNSDIFVPSGDTFRSDPASFIRRNSTEALEFEALAADGSRIKLIPLYQVQARIPCPHQEIARLLNASPRHLQFSCSGHASEICGVLHDRGYKAAATDSGLLSSLVC